MLLQLASEGAVPSGPRRAVAQVVTSLAYPQLHIAMHAPQPGMSKRLPSSNWPPGPNKTEFRGLGRVLPGAAFDGRDGPRQYGRAALS
jgi:hypothetical protein